MRMKNGVNRNDVTFYRKEHAGESGLAVRFSANPAFIGVGELRAGTDTTQSAHVLAGRTVHTRSRRRPSSHPRFCDRVIAVRAPLARPFFTARRRPSALPCPRSRLSSRTRLPPLFEPRRSTGGVCDARRDRPSIRFVPR